MEEASDAKTPVVHTRIHTSIHTDPSEAACAVHYVIIHMVYLVAGTLPTYTNIQDRARNIRV